MRPRETSFPEIADAVQLLHGQLVQHSEVDDPRSHIFTLHFGPNPASLTVHCAWRIVEAENIRCSWQEAMDEYTEPALQALLGQQVVEATVSAFGDLTLRFAAGRALHIWNDAPYEEGDSWVLQQPGRGEFAVACRNWFTCKPAG